jgi:L-ascorbate metabolism protein UlaG (beta-lactamase superfamily)
MCELDRVRWSLAQGRRWRLSRRRLLGGALGLTGGLALGRLLGEPANAQADTGSGAWSAAAPSVPGAAQAQGAGSAAVRWLGGGVLEVATPDYQQLAYVDAWVWNNTGWDAFGSQKPTEYASVAGFRDYVRDKAPQAVLVALTHDHADHIGDYFEVLAALADTGLNVRTCGQSDLMRAGLVDRFRAAGLNPTEIVLNNGNALNFGGRVQHGAMRATLVPAIHSTLLGYPAAGYILELGGIRFYLSGDTDLYGDLRLVGERYHPDVALICAGDGPFTMGPEDAARACQMLGVSQAIPIHFAHNAAVLGPAAGEEFQRAVADLSPGTVVHVLRPGQSVTLRT